jgi:hypothetical protein
VVSIHCAVCSCLSPVLYGTAGWRCRGVQQGLRSAPTSQCRHSAAHVTGTIWALVAQAVSQGWVPFCDLPAHDAALTGVSGHWGPLVQVKRPAGAAASDCGCQKVLITTDSRLRFDDTTDAPAVSLWLALVVWHPCNAFGSHWVGSPSRLLDDRSGAATSKLFYTRALVYRCDCWL